MTWTVEHASVFRGIEGRKVTAAEHNRMIEVYSDKATDSSISSLVTEGAPLVPSDGAGCIDTATRSFRKAYGNARHVAADSWEEELDFVPRLSRRI